MLKPDRLCAFSDGVVAIAITLLVLGLEVPSVHDVPEQELRDYILGALHPILGFVCSFVLIGIYWLQHYAVFHFIDRADRILVALNGLFLMCVSFVPFPTGIQAAYRDDELAMVFYGAAQVACSLALLALWLYASRNHRLVLQGISPQAINSMTWRIAITPVISLAAIALSFLNLTAGRLIFLAIPVVHLSHHKADSEWSKANDSVDASRE
ncbi:MAG: DUF1211 domain-containing protein [Planctomycetaceae bacterium]|nr:DUF1211 domain-containing protein [Planctomycetales bacterium]MCB9927770.1 DUF1211 domain-containing protein [Planctomycetaceae bacterium]